MYDFRSLKVLRNVSAGRSVGCIVTLTYLGFFVKQEFTSSVFLIQRWRDPRLEHDLYGTLFLKGKEVNEKLWIPDIYVTNSNEYILHEDNQLLIIFNNGDIYYSAR